MRKITNNKSKFVFATLVSIAVASQSETFTTDYNDEGNYQSIFLDRHNLSCPEQGVLNGFKLTREQAENGPTGRMRFDFSCEKAEYAQDVSFGQTAFNDEGNGSTIFLDRHAVECKTNEALAGFRLVRSFNDLGQSTGELRYDYRCVDVHASEVERFETSFNDDGGGQTIFLDRHTLMCPWGTALNSFRLVRNDAGNQIKYIYGCVPFAPIRTEEDILLFSDYLSESGISQASPNNSFLEQIKARKLRATEAPQSKGVQAPGTEYLNDSLIEKARVALSFQKENVDEGNWDDEEDQKSSTSVHNSLMSQSSNAKAADANDADTNTTSWLTASERDRAKYAKIRKIITDDEFNQLLDGMPKAKKELLLSKAYGHITAQEYQEKLEAINKAAPKAVEKTESVAVAAKPQTVNYGADPLARLRAMSGFDNDDSDDGED